LGDTLNFKVCSAQGNTKGIQRKNYLMRGGGGGGGKGFQRKEGLGPVGAASSRPHN